MEIYILELRNTIIKIKPSNVKFQQQNGGTEDIIHELGNRSIAITQSEKTEKIQTEKRKKLAELQELVGLSQKI